MTHDFRIAAAQIAVARGQIADNVGRHVAAIEAAGRMGVSVLIFPELSLSGYEPDLAAEFALLPSDARLTPLAEAAQKNGLQVVVGSSVANGSQPPYLGAFVFGSDRTVQTYAKMHLGGTEPQYFTPGEVPLMLESHGHQVGLSICADSSKPSHPAAYATRSAAVYAASVFLNEDWYVCDSPRFPCYAAEYRMLVVMANHGASSGTLMSAGKSAVWSPEGTLLAQADGYSRAGGNPVLQSLDSRLRGNDGGERRVVYSPDAFSLAS